MTEGRKDDNEKARMDLLPPDVLLEVARVLTFGAKKYAPRNWEKGIAYGRVIAGALRHIMAIMQGEDRDPETGLMHSAHAICCMMFLCGYQLRQMPELDDRNWLADHEACEGTPFSHEDDVRELHADIESYKQALRKVRDINKANVAHIHRLEAELRVARAAMSGVHSMELRG